MANYATLKAAIIAAIKQNGNNEITGNLLQQQLLAMVNSLGVGYQYAGTATPETNPGTPDQNVFYLASTAGTYFNLGGFVLADGEIAILKYNGVWSKDSTGAASLEYANKIIVKTAISANIHNSADAVTSETQPNGPDWAAHSLLDGGDFTTNTGGYACSYFIPVVAGQSYKSNVELRHVGFYTNDKAFITGSYAYNTIAANTEIIAPSNAAYIVIQYGTPTNTPNSVKFGLYNDDINVDYEVGTVDKYGDVLLTKDSKVILGLQGNVAELEEEIENGKIHFLQSANIHNSADAVTSETQPNGPDWAGHSIDGSGEFLASSYNLSYYIPVVGGETYKCTKTLRHVGFYDSNKVFVPGSYAPDNIIAGTAIVAPNSASFIILQYNPENSTPDSVRFGLYNDNIDVPYGFVDKDSKGRTLLTTSSDEYINITRQIAQLVEETVKKQIKVLLIGSSFGVNTIVQFPAIAIAGGIDATVGNLYKGSCTLSDIVNIINETDSFNTGRIYTKQSNAWTNATSDFEQMLALHDWDIIIVQRAAPNKAGGSDSWTNEMANDLKTILQYIQAHTTNHPKIMFNSVFGRSVGYFNGSRENEIASANLIMTTAKTMQEQFGLEIIPAAIAIQNARNTSLSYVQTYNSAGYTIPDLTGEGDHLDTGVGSYILGCLLFEQICGKRFDLSVINIDTLPTLANVANNGCFADSCFTQITAEQARIARYAAMCAVRDPWNISAEIGNIFPYPSV